MNHEAYEILISARLDGDLSPEEEARLEEHLAVCPECRRTQKEMKAVRRLLMGAAAVPPAGLNDRILSGLESQKQRPTAWGRRIAPYAVAAVLALVILGVLKPQLPFGSNADQIYEGNSSAAVEMVEEAEEESAIAEAPAEAEEAEEEAFTEEVQQAPQQTQTSNPVLHSNSGTLSEVTPSPSVQTAGSSSSEPASVPAAPSGIADAAPESASDSNTDSATAAGAETETVIDTVPEEAVPVESADSEIPVDVEEASSEIREEEAKSESAVNPEKASQTEMPDEAASSTLSWQQARDRLIAYLGNTPNDLTALDMSPDGKSWLFATGGIRYAVDIHSGAVVPLETK